MDTDTNTSSSQDEALWNNEQTAGYLGVSVRTVGRLTSRRHGALACVKFGQILRFRPADVREFVLQHRLERRVKSLDGIPEDYYPPFMQHEATWEPGEPQ